MKIQQLALGLATAAMMSFTSCVSNDYPTFDDADAFVAMTSTTAYISETGGELEIPVMLTSLSGIEATVDFTLTPAEENGAIEGVHYSLLNSSKSLTFTKDEPVQYIRFNIIDNDTFGGDVKFTISLSKPEGLNLGASKDCVVTIEDDEHPLAFMLGTFTATGESYFNGVQEWTVQFTKDDADLSRVWITNFVVGGSSAANPIYGTVNDEKTEIKIPVKQTLATSSSYPHILLEAYYGEDGEEDVDDYIVGVITTDSNGNAIISFHNYWFGSLVYTDDAATSTAGWYNLFVSGVVLKKN